LTSSTHRTDAVDVPSDEFAKNFGRAPFSVRHHLGIDDPRLTRRALAERARDWPEPWLEHHHANLPFVLPTGVTEPLDLSAEQVIREIDDNGCWLVLWELEHSPRYSALLDECLDPIAAMLGDGEGGITRRGMNLLVSSPAAVVPAHFDMHHNFLLQVEGTKEVMVGTFSDATVREREINRWFDDHNNNLRLLPDDVTTFHLGPGDGLYIPPYAFHWVQGGPEASVGVSCGFRTHLTERTNVVHV
jgi:hypothetical protein